MNLDLEEVEKTKIDKYLEKWKMRILTRLSQQNQKESTTDFNRFPDQKHLKFKRNLSKIKIQAHFHFLNPHIKEIQTSKIPIRPARNRREQPPPRPLLRPYLLRKLSFCHHKALEQHLNNQTGRLYFQIQNKASHRPIELQAEIP